MATRPAVGRFARLTKWQGTEFPAPVWCVIVMGLSAGSIVVEIFHGIEIFNLHTTHRNPQNRLQLSPRGDHFTVCTISTLPQYALTAFTKYKLLKGIE